MTKPQFMIGVFATIFDNQNRVLLCHRRDHDLWNLPGGGLEPNETPLAGIKREILEETGLVTDDIRLVAVYGKEDKNEIVFSFLCTAVSGTLTINDEADKLEYFEIERMPANTIEKHVERIRDAAQFSSEIIFKIQKGKPTL